MASVAFFVDHSQIQGLDFSSPELGNPGCGASEYMPVLIASELGNILEGVEIFTTVMGAYPKHLNIRVVKDISHAMEVAVNSDKILVVRVFQKNKFDFKEIEKKFPSIKIIFWCHLSPRIEFIEEAAHSSQVAALVCLEVHQAASLLDSPISNKLAMIPYGILPIAPNFDVPIPNRVVYVGALTPQKGFHVLAKIWSKVVLRYPDAELFVLGAGDLYNRSHKKMGSLGIAGVGYEEQIVKNLGKSISSVNFLGNVGPELKAKIIQSSVVGIVNPTGETETFCLSAVEIQALGIPCIGGDKMGLKDTIDHSKTGFRVKNERQLIKRIDQLLSDTELAKRMGVAGARRIHERYNLMIIVEQWEQLICRVNENSLPDINESIPSTPRFIIARINKVLIACSRGKLPYIKKYSQSFQGLKKLLFSFSSEIN